MAIPNGKGLPRYTDDGYLNQIRGKAMVGHATLEDMWTLLDHIQLLEHMLDEEVDPNDGLGPSGWREHAEAVSAQWGGR
jgi:hypothetical protein